MGEIINPKWVEKQSMKHNTKVFILAKCSRKTAIDEIKCLVKNLREDESVRFPNGVRITRENRVHPDDFEPAVKGLKHRRKPVLVVDFKGKTKEHDIGKYKVGF